MKDDLIPLHDILKEIEFLHSIRGRSTFESFKAHSADVRAASYSIMVISEAVRRIPDDWLAAYPDAPWRHPHHRQQAAPRISARERLAGSRFMAGNRMRIAA